MNQSTSPFASIDLVDIKKTALHLLLIAGASFALYIIDNVVPQINWGKNAALIAPIVSTLVDFGRRFFTNYTAQQ